MNKQFILKALGLLITVVAIAYFVAVAIHNAASLPAINWTWRTYLSISGDIALYNFIVAIGGYAWFLWLRGVKETGSVILSLVIYALANIAKYIPGNVGQYVGRVALAHRYGLQVSKVILTLPLEAAWGILSSAATAIAILVVVGPDYAGTSGIPAMWEIGVVAVVAGVAPIMGIEILKRWQPGPLKKLFGSTELVVPGRLTLCACFLLYTSTFLIMGGIANSLARYLFGALNAPFWLITGIITVAWVAGFITPGSPAGMGVREAILVAALGPILGTGVALGVSIALRAVTTLGDGLAFLAALALKRFAVPAVASRARINR